MFTVVEFLGAVVLILCLFKVMFVLLVVRLDVGHVTFVVVVGMFVTGRVTFSLSRQ